MDKSPNLLDSNTATAPVLETPRPAGSGIIPELVTAGWSRHEERDSSHDARVEREDQVGDASSAINFLRLLGDGSSCSHPEHKDMAFNTTRSTFLTPRGLNRTSVGQEDPLPLMGSLFMVDTMGLTHEQRSIYMLLLVHSWYIKAPLPDDDEYLARVSETRKHAFANRFRPIAGDFFDISEGCWRPNAGHIQDPQSRRLPQAEWQLIRRQIFQRDDYTCTYCGYRGSDVHCDHVIPISRGGSNHPDNLTTACAVCNISKSAMTVDEWLASGLMPISRRHDNSGKGA